MSDAADSDFVTIGRVVKAHGIRGEVSVHVLTDVPDRFAPGTEVGLGATATTIVASRPHQGRMLVSFENVLDRTAAERLRGCEVTAAPLDLDDHETYFAHELVGLRVVAEDERELGVVSALIELPGAAGYDLLEVRRSDGSTWLLPAADDLVEVEPVPGSQADRTDDPAIGVPLRLRLVDAPDGMVDGEPDVVRDDGGTT